LLIWLFGGGITAFGTSFPLITGVFRSMAGILGIILIGLGFFAFITSIQSRSEPVTDTRRNTPVSDASTSEPVTDTRRNTPESDAPTSDVIDWIDPVDTLPASYNCPFRSDGMWLQFPNTEYGPFWDASGVGYSIAYSQNLIYVANSVHGMVGTYNDPGLSAQRNKWISLNGVPFTVCVDLNGYVFAAYTP
ncbi:MAG: hypothetical protein KDE53_40965, partial [Caldilineaceae bacterium]|nr:hypothetical protein [Caldilineaceae bacterium]